MTPFCCASPPLVVVRRMPSDTSNTWKMMTVPMSAMAIATISSTMLMPACRALVAIDGRHDGVVVHRKPLGGFLGRAPEHFDLHGPALAGGKRADRHFRLGDRGARE